MAKIILVGAWITLCAVSAYWGPDLPPGPYCGLKDGRGGCCVNRRDECAHQILGTLCYCDEFCNRTTAADDCCPDYAPVCLNQSVAEPIMTPCKHDGTFYIPGDTAKINCNLCTCRQGSNNTSSWDCDNEICLMDEGVEGSVNAAPRGWRAHIYEQFLGRTLKEGIKLRLGTLPLRPETRHMGSIRYEAGALPERFDARTHWPRRYISPVRDQGWCGSDWAISTAAVLSDRFAIQSKGVLNGELSAQTLLSCNARGQQGCGGGHIDSAWQFASKYGLVSESCLPYESRSKACPYPLSANATKVPCGNGDWSKVYRSGPPSKLSTEKDIMYDIMNWGPVQAVMTVYQDLFHYREGVYRHTSLGDTRLRGQHSVRIVGWGTERGDNYWIVANSWGEHWGERGYVRVARDDSTTLLEFVVTTLADVAEAIGV